METKERLEDQVVRMGWGPIPADKAARAPAVSGGGRGVRLYLRGPWALGGQARSSVGFPMAAPLGWYLSMSLCDVVHPASLLGLVLPLSFHQCCSP